LEIGAKNEELSEINPPLKIPKMRIMIPMLEKFLTILQGLLPKD
jgi:hypothetical protein